MLGEREGAPVPRAWRRRSWWGPPALLGAAAVGSGCAREGGSAPSPEPLPPIVSSAAASAPSQPRHAAPSSIPPLRPHEASINLPVAGFLPAIARAPVGARERRPVVVVVHGHNDSPQWQCPVARGILGKDVFLLCPRGAYLLGQPEPATPYEARYTFESPEALDAEIRAGIRALKWRFPLHVDDGPWALLGFSLGANYGVDLAVMEPARFPWLILIEGGHDRWTPEAARSYGARGGRRVLFVCGGGGCVADAEGKVPLLNAAGIATTIAHAVGAGHTMTGAVADETRKALGWLFGGEARWASR